MRGAATFPSRAAVEAAVEALLALLDGMDGDPDLELDTSDDEHTLGWSETSSIKGSGFGLGADDFEPSLAALDQPDQRRWSEHDDSGRRLAMWVDAEQQCEDEGADDEREPDADDTDEAWPDGRVA